MLAWEPIRYARNGDVSIAYRTGGAGPVDLLFISGFVSHLEIGVELALAQRFFERLGSFARVIAFDKRGMGLSDRGAYTLENVVDDALAVLDDVGVERAVVFGISEGGSAATMLAAAHPERVRSLVLYGAFARVARAADYPQGVPPDVLDGFVARMAAEWGQAAMLELWAPSLAGDPEAVDWWARWLRSGTSPGAMRTLGLMYRELDVRPLLSSVTAPALVLYRADDQLIQPPLARVVARGIPGAREVELAGTDHLFVAGDQDAMLDEVEEFVTGRPAAPARERLLANVLFTDIVRSTERAAEVGDRRWSELLTQHDRVVERELARHRGSMAARVQAAAEPGEVLTSGTVKDLVVGSGLEFEDRGSHVLKGVPGEWPLYAVTGDAERAQAPVAAAP